MRRTVLVLALAVSAFPSRHAAAQVDDQPPVLRRKPTATSSEPKSKRGSSKQDDTPLVTATGVIRHFEGKTFDVEAEDTRILTCTVTGATSITGSSGKMTFDDLVIGMHVRVEAKPDNEEEKLFATSVTVEKAPPGVAPEKTATIQKAPPPEAGDEDRPVLRRGIPAKRKSAASGDDDQKLTASAAAKPPDPDRELSREAPRMADPETKEDPAIAKAQASPTLIDRAREADEEFTEHLPNFFCQQFTARYSRESKETGWQARDVVSATVVFVNGKEDYQNIKIGSRSVDKDMMAIKGQRSVGEFGSVLHSLLQPASQAEFRFVRDQQVHRLSAKVYDFKVQRERSDWRIMVNGQSIVPGYSGRVWIDRESARVLRIERQADNIPEAFPDDALEQTIDYDFVAIGSRKVLLPTQSENLGCERGTPYCGKNVIEFRNYREFRGDANISFDK